MGQGYDSYLVIGNQCNGMGFWGVGSFPHRNRHHTGTSPKAEVYLT